MKRILAPAFLALAAATAGAADSTMSGFVVGGGDIVVVRMRTGGNGLVIPARWHRP